MFADVSIIRPVNTICTPTTPLPEHGKGGNKLSHTDAGIDELSRATPCNIPTKTRYSPK